MKGPRAHQQYLNLGFEDELRSYGFKSKVNYPFSSNINKGDLTTELNNGSVSKARSYPAAPAFSS